MEDILASAEDLKKKPGIRIFIIGFIFVVFVKRKFYKF